MKYDVIIAGGGIGGTVLAHLLGKAGRKVLVLEKSTAPPAFIRPEGLWPVTAELLRAMLPSYEGAASPWIPLQGLRAFDGQDELAHITSEIFQRAGVRLAMTDPNWTREQLMKLTTFELRRGMEVTGVLKENGRAAGVRARSAEGKVEEFTAPWTVGDDGVNSRVRQDCGIELTTKIFPVDLMTFGFTWPKSLPEAVGHIFFNRKRTKTGIIALAAVPMPGGKGATIIPIRPDKIDAAKDNENAWAEFCASDPRIQEVAGARKFPQDLARVRRPWGHVERYGIDGAVLIGDAAHPVSPVGGQGANMAVADAAALADAMLSNAPDIVAAYERRRRPANERSIDFTRSAANAFTMPAFLVDPMIPFFIRRLNNNFEDLLRSASTAFQDHPS